jgi:hypothetical protein
VAISPEELKRMRACSPLLPPPGDDVVVKLLDEIERLNKIVDEKPKEGFSRIAT